MRLAVLFAVVIFLFGCVGQSTAKIKTFEDCVNAGYPILESYPRQCRTPDGRNFISGTDFLEVNQNASCSKDADCRLVNKKLGFGCCWAGACEALNYSEDKWIALNKEWFEDVQEKNCPSKPECGPAPMCAVRAIDTNFSAKCISSQCKKVQITANITVPEVNLTGNLTMPNVTINETNNVTGNGEPDLLNDTFNGPLVATADQLVTDNLTGILFGNGTYLLVLEDISTVDDCALMAVHFAANQSEITKLKGCPGQDVNWASPEGRIFRIKVIKTAAGYAYAGKWAQVVIYG